MHVEALPTRQVLQGRAHPATHCTNCKFSSILNPPESKLATDTNRVLAVSGASMPETVNITWADELMPVSWMALEETGEHEDEVQDREVGMEKEEGM